MASPNTPFAWLGLLKWSLSYTDGTSEETPMPMSEEDKAFLEKVMKDGIIDEGERMKTILIQLTDYLDGLKNKTGTDDAVGQEETKAEQPELDEDAAVELLMELRDIVEQIDYARAFSAMGGVQFLMGCASERVVVPRSIRSSCLGVLATLCQNNPPVQSDMLERGAISNLSDMYFKEFPQSQHDAGDADESDGMVRGRIVQAIGCCVRGHALAEQQFCSHDEARKVIESGLGLHVQEETLPEPPSALKKRCLFFLRALVTSDASDASRVALFEPCIRRVASSCLDPATEPEAEIREMTLGLLDMLLKQNKNICAILEMKGELVGLGIQRVKELRGLQGEERDIASVELEHWESFIVGLARADAGTTEQGEVAREVGKPGDANSPLLLK